MNIEAFISKIDEKILNLCSEKAKFVKIWKAYPEAIIQNNAVCLPDIWDKITRMQIRRSYGYSTLNLTANFTIGRNFNIEGLRVCAQPFDVPVATVTWLRGTQMREVKVFDYKNYISSECNKKNPFEKRIKDCLKRFLVQNNTNLDASSAYFDEYEKIMILK